FCFGRWNMKNKLTSKINKKNYELGKIKIENANNLSSIVTLEKDKEDIKKELNHMSSGILKILQEKNSSLKTVPLDWKMKVEAKDLDNSATSLNASFLDNNPVDEVKGNNNELSLTNGNNKDVFGTFTNDIIQKVAKKNTGSQV
ncbi:hypothetical protein KAH94_02590, partial [bacterium]|nr:hypothetical protein [bacterium]